MEIVKKVDGDQLFLAPKGRLDTVTAPEFEKAFKESHEGITKVVIDLSELMYISSAGLRVLLSAQKIMNKQGSMTVKNVNDDVREIFEVTGFTDLLNIE